MSQIISKQVVPLTSAFALELPDGAKIVSAGQAAAQGHVALFILADAGAFVPKPRQFQFFSTHEEIPDGSAYVLTAILRDGALTAVAHLFDVTGVVVISG